MYAIRSKLRSLGAKVYKFHNFGSQTKCLIYYVNLRKCAVYGLKKHVICED